MNTYAERPRPAYGPQNKQEKQNKKRGDCEQGKDKPGNVKRIIGITGGAGAGKSAVLQILKEESGAHIIMADEVGRKLMEPGEICFEQIVKSFGSDIVKEDGKLDREKLAELAFGNEDRLRLLNGIVHPRVKEAVREEIAASGRELTAVETALLIEAGFGELCDELWYIYAPAQERVRRLYENRGYSEVKSYAIMSSQLSDSQFRKNCDFLVDNGRSIEETRKQIIRRLRETGVYPAAAGGGK